MTIRFGSVGTGGIANTHADALAVLSNEAELVSCCDALPGRAAEFAQRWNVPRHYHSAREMLDAGGVDVICVCTPLHNTPTRW